MAMPANGTEIQPLVTSRGRKSGNPHTVQIRIYCWDRRLIATSPYPTEKRDWVRNIMEHPEVSIRSGSNVVRATARIVDQDLETKSNVAMRRISWRGSRCPVFQPSTDTFVEFFPERPVEELFEEAQVTHSPEIDPLAASTLTEILEWQSKDNRYPRQPSRESPAQG